MTYKFGFWGLLVLFILFMTFWAYWALDKGISSTHRNDEVERQIVILKTIFKDYSNSGCSQDIRTFIKSNYDKKSIFEDKQDYLNYEEIGFRFEKSKLKDIETP